MRIHEYAIHGQVIFWKFIDIPVGVSDRTVICPEECALPDQVIKANPKISAVFSNDSIQECLFLPGKWKAKPLLVCFSFGK